MDILKFSGSLPWAWFLESKHLVTQEAMLGPMGPPARVPDIHLDRREGEKDVLKGLRFQMTSNLRFVVQARSHVTFRSEITSMTP